MVKRIGIFNVRTVEKGEKAGSLRTHDKEEPIVEFYDATVGGGFGEYGQFITSYYVDTLSHDVDSLVAKGIDLYARVPEWKLSGKQMVEVFLFLQQTFGSKIFW